MARRQHARRLILALVALTVAYVALAYLVLPALWSHHEHEPGLAALPMVTRTSAGIPGDPLNVGLIGSKQDVLRAMNAAGWFPAFGAWNALSSDACIMDDTPRTVVTLRQY